MTATADKLQELYDSAPNSRLIMIEGALNVDVPKPSSEDTADDQVVVVMTREALLERVNQTGSTPPTAEQLRDLAPAVDDMAAKLGA